MVTRALLRHNPNLHVLTYHLKHCLLGVQEPYDSAQIGLLLKRMIAHTALTSIVYSVEGVVFDTFS